MSLEELSLRDGLVVCPQCLTAYQAVEQGTLPPQVSRLEDSTTATHAKRFCPHCGEKIGQGRENAKVYLETHPDIMQEIENTVRERYDLGGEIEVDSKATGEEEA